MTTQRMAPPTSFMIKPGHQLIGQRADPQIRGNVA